MKILHCCLSNFYIDNYNYQENVLPKCHKHMGHDVRIIASTETFDNGKLTYIEPKEYLTETGIPIKRINYSKAFPFVLSKKIRKFPDFEDELWEFLPDIILFHGTCGYELLTAAKYKEKMPNTKLYVDSHEDYHTSARTWMARNTLYRFIYKPIVKRTCEKIDKVLCVSTEAEAFCNELLNIPTKKIEWYPLGGELVPPKERDAIRMNVRRKENVSNDFIVFVHSGKMDARKRTKEIIEAFSSVDESNFRLWIIGILMDDVKEEVQKLIEKDRRISFLGWKKSDELLQYLCASDFYIQPGGQSVTMQNAMCCGCAVMLYPHKSHKPFVDGNGYYVSTVNDMRNAFIDIKRNPQNITEMNNRSVEIACEFLDYNKLADRIIH